MERRKTAKFEDKEKRILEILEQAKKTNDFIKFDKYLIKLHKLRSTK